MYNKAVSSRIPLHFLATVVYWRNYNEIDLSRTMFHGNYVYEITDYTLIRSFVRFRFDYYVPVRVHIQLR